MTSTRADPPWVLGISASHNGAVCLLHGDEIVAVVQEERLSRKKRDRVFGAEPSLAVAYCLETAGIDPADLALVVSCVQGHASDERQDIGCNRQLRLAARGVPWRVISHHLGHAVSTFASSGYEDAAILVIDGVGSPFEDLDPAQRAVARGGPGDWEMISLFHGVGREIKPLEQHLVAQGEWLPRRPRGMPLFRTLGGMYSAVAKQIFGDVLEAGKVMGLAPYGQVAHPVDDFFMIDDGRLCFRDVIPARFDHDQRWPACQREYEDLAASVQSALEVAVLDLAARLRLRTGATRLCYAGGVALNCIVNERLWRESGFTAVHVPPAADDSGPAIGAAFYGLWLHTGKRTYRPARSDSVGREYAAAAIDAAIAAVPGLRLVETGRPRVLDAAVRRLTAGQFCGWFQGRSELGPRALGQRSILADPRGATIKDDLNARVKGREGFRPFAPAVLGEEVHRWFDLEGLQPGDEALSSPFMLRVWPVIPALRGRIPAVVHVDGTARVQTVHDSDGPYHAILCRFRDATGVPILLNTSFNGPGEPIVETPADALWCALQIGLDFVVIGDRLVERDPGVRSLLDLVPRIVATSYAVEIPLTDGRFSTSAPGDAVLRFQVTTPWGLRTQEVPGHLCSLLEAIDGATDGWGLLNLLSRIGGEGSVDEAWLAKALARLRNAGIITLALQKP